MRTAKAITDGARALRAFVDSPHVSRGELVQRQGVPDFCEEHGLPRLSIQRALRGELQRITVDLAEAIERATGNAVLWKSWLSRTARTDGGDGE